MVPSLSGVSTKTHPQARHSSYSASCLNLIATLWFHAVLIARRSATSMQSGPIGLSSAALEPLAFPSSSSASSAGLKPPPACWAAGTRVSRSAIPAARHVVHARVLRSAGFVSAGRHLSPLSPVAIAWRASCANSKAETVQRNATSLPDGFLEAAVEQLLQHPPGASKATAPRQTPAHDTALSDSKS